MRNLEPQPRTDATPLKPETAAPEAHSAQPPQDTLSGFLPLLIALRRPRQHLTAPPDFIPKTFEESIQFYDDEDTPTPDRRVYFYFNNVWSYITLT